MASIAATWKRWQTFWSETRSEMRKVTFPSRPEVVGTTIVVLIATFIFAFFLYFADQVIIAVLELLYKAIG